MSEPLRVAAAVEGPTDAIVFQAILRALLPDDAELVFQRLQPEGSAAFGKTGAGWAGVYRWSRQSAGEGGGSVSGSSVLSHHDLLIVHVDADVAGNTYANGGIHDAPLDDLPCEEPCPPPARQLAQRQTIQETSRRLSTHRQQADEGMAKRLHKFDGGRAL